MKKIILALMICGSLMMVGCDDITRDATEEEAKHFPEFSFTKYEIGAEYSVLVDNETGVMYLEYTCGNLEGLTVMLNQDGTPRTWKGNE